MYNHDIAEKGSLYGTLQHPIGKPLEKKIPKLKKTVVTPIGRF